MSHKVTPPFHPDYVQDDMSKQFDEAIERTNYNIRFDARVRFSNLQEIPNGQ